MLNFRGVTPAAKDLRDMDSDRVLAFPQLAASKPRTLRFGNLKDDDLQNYPVVMFEGVLSF